MTNMTSMDCYISGLYYYYDKIVSSPGVCDGEGFSLLSDFKIALDDFNLFRRKPNFDRLCQTQNSWYVDGYLKGILIQNEIVDYYDCISELMMRLKRLFGR